MAILTNGTWVLIADGEKALFLRNDVDEQDPDLNVVRIEEQENPSDREQSANRPGRMHDGGPGQKSAVEDTDWHELAKERFADDLAEILYKQAHKGKFDRIVLVAPPATLGELRSKLHKEVSDKVVAELDKTLTNHPLDKIEKLLRDEFAPA
ncbi:MULTISPECIES: host attachment protein [Roseobacteraceae]|uniref:baeRF12 domain-containing protein n=1 Tax=Roseobacteraceae TaxID=2854170 RepID=UPI00080ABD11|nr:MULTISPECIES: host attachment family protein [Roseobacteraceae]ANT59195.1 Host attachment protein [Salipiger sp. CCB-MM3]MCA0996515.1 host attachment family protein [Alloyangia pacifica]NDV98064.1 host attachment protein [Salipiger sp. PrR002]NDW57039.1 host attachment protein [Salipiger sp. PrR004]